jgi:hypothetical protein
MRERARPSPRPCRPTRGSRLPTAFIAPRGFLYAKRAARRIPDRSKAADGAKPTFAPTNQRASQNNRGAPVRYFDVRPARPERFPSERNRSNDKKSIKIKMLERALIEKV